eukprot:scaffold99980_cov57-Phaeocystis_antarctica.AAC.1
MTGRKHNKLRTAQKSTPRMVGAVSRAPDPPTPASNHTKVRRRPYNTQWCDAERRPARPPKLQQRVLEACATCRGKHGYIGLLHQDQG